jgi:hypothetical protein
MCKSRETIPLNVIVVHAGATIVDIFGESRDMIIIHLFKLSLTVVYKKSSLDIILILSTYCLNILLINREANIIEENRHCLCLTVTTTRYALMAPMSLLMALTTRRHLPHTLQLPGHRITEVFI